MIIPVSNHFPSEIWKICIINMYQRSRESCFHITQLLPLLPFPMYIIVQLIHSWHFRVFLGDKYDVCPKIFFLIIL